MKNTKYILIPMLAIMLTGLMPSCKKGFLDKNPTDAISSQTFWQSDVDVQMGLTGVYRRLQSGFFSNRKLWLETYSDNAYDRHSFFYGFQTLTLGSVNPTNVTTTFYTTPYTGISSCNFFLDNVDKAPISDASKNTYKAEVRFLRALFYFDLVQSYGGVVIYKTSPQTVEASKIKQSTKAEVLAFIHDDLDFAIANLADVPYNGHAVKGSAQALKVKAYLFDQKWPEAAIVANQIITGGKFSLYQGGYDKLFFTATQQNNPEIMFSTKFLAPDNPQIGEGALVEVSWYGSIAPYKNLVDDYEMTNGKRINDPGSGYDAANPYVNRDPRLRTTIELPIDQIVHTDPLPTGFVQRKYIDFSLLPPNKSFDRTFIVKTDANIIHLRYADVLLMYAEAKNEATGPDATIYNALNAIRSRTGVGMPAVDQTVYNTKEKLREFIQHERRIELALEGHRYFDLKRWGLMAAKLAAITSPGGQPLLFGEKNNVLPFPQSELDRNPNLDQNPGY